MSRSIQQSITQNGVDVARSNSILAMSNVAAGVIIGQSVKSAGHEIGTNLKEGLIKNAEITSENIIKGNMMIASNILSSSTLIANELRMISSEIERNIRFQELKSLKESINRDENWLSERGLLKNFYEEINIESKYIPYIEVNMDVIPLLSRIFDFKLVKSLEEFMEKEAKCDWEALLQEYCILNLCDPISYIFDLICDNGFVYFLTSRGSEKISEDETDKYLKIRETNRFFIVRTGFSFYVDDGPWKFFINEGKCEYGSGKCIAHIKFKTFEASEYLVKYTEEEARKFIEYMIELNKDYVICERDKLLWTKFYGRLNSEIAYHNLRILSNELELYVRKTKMEA